MKKIKIILISIFCILVFNSNVFADEINSPYYGVYNAENMELLIGQNTQEKIAIASITKIMTAIVTIDNIQDVNEVVNYYKSEWFKKIFLVWHSYWWIVNLYVNHENISWILMWDSSIWWPWLLEDVHEDESGEYYIDWWNWYRFYISEKLYRDFQIPSEEFLEKLKEIKLPIKIFAAENWLSKAAERYFEVANEPKQLSIIKWAYHTFEDWWMEELLSQSIEWINNN